METKIVTPSHRSAFTLIELLVVITIIGILTGIMLPVGHQVMKSMRKTQATKTATELRTALMNYYTEYKRFPALQTSTSTDTEVKTDESTGLITALMAVPDSQHTKQFNRRGILFFSTKTAKSKDGPGVWGSGSNYKLNDPWGMPYIVAYDSNYDNQIEVPSKVGGGKEPLFASVAVWSWGPNAEEGKGKEKKNDDIYAF